MFSCRGLYSGIRGSHVAFLRPVIHSAQRYNATWSTEKPLYIAMPIFYPSPRPHLDHLHPLLMADINVRFQRILNPTQPVVFLTDTDGHGLEMQRAAEAKSVDPLVWCRVISTELRELGERANISKTVLMRTMHRKHWEAVEHVWHALVDQGLIYKDTYEGYYSDDDECFYPSSQSRPTPRTPTSKFRNVLRAHYTAAVPHNALATDDIASCDIHLKMNQNAAQHDLEDPFKDLSISRPRERIGWGIAVPGDASQTVYVWFDALLVYLSGAGHPAEAWAPVAQVVDEDIVRFHEIYLPVVFREICPTIPKALLTHARWAAKKKRTLKPFKKIADPMTMVNDFGVDIVRFYLARVGRRFQDDVDWSEEQLQKHADEIRELLGNYFLRVTSDVVKTRAAKVMAISSDPLSSRDLFSRQFPNLDLSSTPTSSLDPETCELTTNEELLSLLDDLGTRVSCSMRSFEMADGLHTIVLVLKHANVVLTTLEPWSDAHPPDVVVLCYLAALETLRITGILLQPFIPHTSEKLLDALNVPVGERSIEYARVGRGEVNKGLVMNVRGVKLFDTPTKKSSLENEFVVP